MSPARGGGCTTRRQPATPWPGSDVLCGRPERERDDDVGRGTRRDVAVDEGWGRGDRDRDDGNRDQTAGGDAHQSRRTTGARAGALMPMVIAMSRARQMSVVAVAHWHCRGHISVRRHCGVMRARAGACDAHPAAAVFWTRLQRDPGDRDDHPEPEKSRQDTLCRRPPHCQQSMDRRTGPVKATDRKPRGPPMRPSPSK